MAHIVIFDSHQPALEDGAYKISISQDFSVQGNTLSIKADDLNFIVAGEQYTIDEQQIDSIFPPPAAMGDFSLVLPHIILNRSTLPWERDPMDGSNGNPWLALLLFTEDELSATDEITSGKSFCIQHVLKNTWQKPGEGEKGDLISIIVYAKDESLKNILPQFKELPFLAHVRANGEEQKAVIVCNRLPKPNRKNIVHLVSLENRFEKGSFNPKQIDEGNAKSNFGLVTLKSWEFFCNDHFLITQEVLDHYKTSTKKDNQGNFLVYEALSNAISKIIGKEYFGGETLIKEVKEKYEGDRTKISDTQIDFLLKSFRIGHLPEILKHLNRTPSTLRLPDDKPLNFYISQDRFDLYKASTLKDPLLNISLVITSLIQALAKNILASFESEQHFIGALPKIYQTSYTKRKEVKTLSKTDNSNLARIDYALKFFEIRKIVEPPDVFLQQGFINAPYSLKTGKQIEALYRGPLIPGLPGNAITNPICIRHADEALRYYKDLEKLDVSYASAWQLGKLLAIQNKNFSIALYKWKRLCYQTIKQNKEVSASNCPVPALVSDWFSNVKNLNGIPFNYLVPDPSFTPFESIRFFNIDENWIMYLIDGAFSIGRISEAEGRYDNLLYNKSFNFLKAMPAGRSGFLLHSAAVAGWPDLVIYDTKIDDNKFNGPDGYSKCANEGESYEFINNADVAYGANGTFTFENGVSGNISFDNKRFGDPIPGIYKAGYYKFHKNKLSHNLLLCHFNRAINAVGIHQKPASIHFGFEDLDDSGKLFNGDFKISYSPENSPDEAKKMDLSTIQFKNTAELVNNLVQKIEVITFQAR